MSRHPVANALHRHFFARNEIPLDEHAPDRGIGVAVVRIVVDAKWDPVLEDYPRRALDLDGKGIERILDPANFKLLPVERTGFDRAAIVVRSDLILVIAPADQCSFVWERARPRLVSGCDQVARAPVERNMEFGAGKARALNNRFVIAGHESLGLPQAGDTHRDEI